MGTKTDEYLASLFADSLKREIEGDEAIWRSLPFFAAILGLAVAVLPPVFNAGTRLTGTVWLATFCLLFGASLLAFGWAGFWFGRVVRLRKYRYPPDDAALLAYADGLRAFYAKHKLSKDALDERVRNRRKQEDMMAREAATPKPRSPSTERAEPASKPKPPKPQIVWEGASFFRLREERKPAREDR